MYAVRNQGRLGYLDSIRGIAAFVVVLSHCWLLLPPDITETANPGLFNAMHSLPGFFLYSLSKLHECGRSAVIIFFVLSGFVLAYSLEKTPIPYVSYLIKRFFRIYPPFLVVVLTSYALHLCIGNPHEVLSKWLKTVNNPDLGFYTLLESLFMAGLPGNIHIDGPIWSLFHEMRISLVFPFILLCLRRNTLASMLVFFLLSIVCAMNALTATGTVIFGYEEDTVLMSLLDSAFFIVFFAAGGWLAMKHETVASRIAYFPRWAQVMLGMFSCYCLLKTDYNHHSLAGCFDDYIRGMGALALIALVLGVDSISNTLSHGIFIWLGRISYSLYLVHIPILYVINQTFGATWSALEISLVFVPLSVLSAEIVARLIEFPSIRLGKKLSSHFT